MAEIRQSGPKRRTINYAPINSKLQHPPPPGQSLGIEGIVQIPAPTGEKNVQMPYPTLEFVCQEPSSEYVIIAISDSGAKKKKFETFHFRFNFPHPADTKVNISSRGGSWSFELIGALPIFGDMSQLLKWPRNSPICPESYYLYSFPFFPLLVYILENNTVYLTSNNFRFFLFFLIFFKLEVNCFLLIL